MAMGTGERRPEFDLEEAFDAPRLRLGDFRGAAERAARVPSLRVHLGLPRGGARSPGESGLVRERRNGCDLRVVRQLGSSAGLEEELGATYAFASDFWQHGAAARAYGVFDEETGAPGRGTFLIDKDGRRDLVAGQGGTARPRWCRSRSGVLDGRREPALHVETWGDPESPRVVFLHGVTGHGRRARGWHAGGSPTIASSLRTCSATARRPTSRHGASTSTCDCWSKPRRPNLQPGSGTLSAAGSRSRSPFVTPSLVERLVLLDPALRSMPRWRWVVAENRDEGSGRTARSRKGSIAGSRRDLHDAPGSRRRGAPRAPGRVRGRPLALSLQPGRRDRRVRRDGARPSAFRDVRIRRCSCSAGLVRPLRPPDRGPPGRTRRLLEEVTVPGGHTVHWDALEETSSRDRRIPGRRLSSASRRGHVRL